MPTTPTTPTTPTSPTTLDSPYLPFATSPGRPRKHTPTPPHHNHHNPQLQQWLTSLRTILIRNGNPNHFSQRCIDTLLFATTGDLGWIPQCSGLSFVILPYLFSYIRPPAVQRVLRTPAVRWSNAGLTISTLLFWNYVMQQQKRGRWYSLLYSFDYAMIGTTALTSTFPYQLRTFRHWAMVVAGFGAAMVAHVNVKTVKDVTGITGLTGWDRDHSLESFRGHHYACMLSTLVGIYRSARSGHWTPTLIRGYSTLVCTVLFYTTIHRVERLEEYKGLMWWLPWMWHLHAGVCQGASLEVVGGV